MSAEAQRKPKRPDGAFCEHYDKPSRQRCDKEGWLLRCPGCSARICDEHWEAHRRER